LSIGGDERPSVLRQSNEKRLEELLEREFQGGTLAERERLRILEEFRTARAQQKASIYALYAAIAAGASAAFAAASLVISLLALYSR
jgi:hypothetical protein